MLSIELISDSRVTVDNMELIEAEFNEGVLRPMRRLRLRPGERVGIVVVRRPDPLRWDLARLSKVIQEEDTLTEAGLAEWETTLSREDQS
jgi:predicted DNA-binding antitoxin AbrB/MazE fold protein